MLNRLCGQHISGVSSAGAGIITFTLQFLPENADSQTNICTSRLEHIDRSIFAFGRSVHHVEQDMIIQS